MTTTAERAKILAEHCEKLSSGRFLGEFSAADLIEWIVQELGHAGVMDDFIPYGAGGKFSMATKAVPNGPILHILSGNTPHAGLQSLLRGLLIGAENLVKFPSAGLHEVNEWVDELPNDLKKLVTVVHELSDDIFDSARTVIGIGSDHTMDEIQKRISPRQRFIPHGYKLSVGLVEFPSPELAELVVRDACAFNQQGCLSIHTVYVVNGAKEFIPMLADAMRAYEIANPRGEIGISESGAISNLREVVRYEAANDPQNIVLEQSEGDTRWTVIYRNSPTLTPSVLNRVVTVQPWPENFADLGAECNYISTLAVEKSLLSRGKFFDLPDVPRICVLGKSQMPSLAWHHDGFAPLASLVRWRDIDSEASFRIRY
jgi:hypothetical protein